MDKNMLRSSLSYSRVVTFDSSVFLLLRSVFVFICFFFLFVSYLLFFLLFSDSRSMPYRVNPICVLGCVCILEMSG